MQQRVVFFDNAEGYGSDHLYSLIILLQADLLTISKNNEVFSLLAGVPNSHKVIKTFYTDIYYNSSGTDNEDKSSSKTIAFLILL